MARRERNDEGASGWQTAAGIAVGVTAAAVGVGAVIGLMSKMSSIKEQQSTEQELSSDEEEDPRAITYNTSEASYYQSASSSIRNINGLLDDIYARHIALKDAEFKQHYAVFESIFGRLHETMKEVDLYYKRYSSTVQFAGSHYDGLRINKPDEIDLDIVIRLPADMRAHPAPAQTDVVLEHKTPAHVQLKMGAQFQNLLYREDWHINQTAYKWMDEKKYLLRSKFLNWFRSVVVRALNCFGKNEYGVHFCPVDCVFYTIRTSGSGPAVTLIIENEDGFQLSVDLVPAIKFPEERWPICRGYRDIPPGCERGYFMVVPKENKALSNQIDRDRAWRLALHLQERELMHDTNHLRQTIRFIKKLRDSQGMVQITSYFIKTLFYHELVQQPDAKYWQHNTLTLLKYMSKKLEQALRIGSIPYFWNKDFNLLWDVNRSTLIGYANKLKEFIRVLETPSEFREAARMLLTKGEYEEYKPKLGLE